jgi:hypothetical protein
MKNAVYAAVCAVSLLGTAASAQQYDWLYGREGKAPAWGHYWLKNDSASAAQAVPKPADEPVQKTDARAAAAKLPTNYIPGPEGRKMDAGQHLFDLLFGNSNEAKQFKQSLKDTLKVKYSESVKKQAAQEEELFVKQRGEIDQLVKAKKFSDIKKNILDGVFKSDRILIYAIDAVNKAKGPAQIVSHAVLTKFKNGPAHDYADNTYKKWIAKTTQQPRYWEKK